MPQREPQVRALPVSTTSCVCALALAPPCAHLSRPRRGRCAGPVAASLPEDDHGSTPTARERPTPKRSSRRYRDCGSNTRCARARAPARLLAHVWLHPSSLQAFALLSARCAARRAHCGADIAAVDAGCAAADAPASPLIAAIRTVHRDTSSTLPISSLCRPPHGCSVPLFSSSAGVCLCTVAGAPSCGARAVWLCVVPRRDSRAPKPLGGVLAKEGC